MLALLRGDTSTQLVTIRTTTHMQLQIPAIMHNWNDPVQPDPFLSATCTFHIRQTDGTVD